jgi:hypothetical protein
LPTRTLASEDGVADKRPSGQQLLLNNRIWVKQKTAEDPEYFTKLAKRQSPKVLWIGEFHFISALLWYIHKIV